MQNAKPCVGELAPTAPGLGEFCQFRRCGESLFRGLMTEGDLAQPVCPGLGPLTKPRGLCVVSRSTRRSPMPEHRRNPRAPSSAAAARRRVRHRSSGPLGDTARANRAFHTRRVPGHCRVIGISCGDDTTRRADAAHFAKGRDRMAEVLQSLMSVNDVEGTVGKLHRVDVAQRQREIAHLLLSGQRLASPQPQPALGSIPITEPSVSQSAKSIEMVPGQRRRRAACRPDSAGEEVRRGIRRSTPAVRCAERSHGDRVNRLPRRVSAPGKCQCSAGQVRPAGLVQVLCGRNQDGRVARRLRHLRRSRNGLQRLRREGAARRIWRSGRSGSRRAGRPRGTGGFRPSAATAADSRRPAGSQYSAARSSGRLRVTTR